MVKRCFFCLLALYLPAYRLCRTQSGPAATGLRQALIQDGVSVEISLDPLQRQLPPGHLIAGADVSFQIAIRDVATKSPIRGLHPAAWMDLHPKGQPHDDKYCSGRLSAILSANLLDSRAQDLNIYYVLALNQDNTITVADPRFGYGGTNLLALVALPGRGEDWLLVPDGSRLFVSVPDTGQVSAVDTASWKTMTNLNIGATPHRIGLQPDAHYLWVAYDGPGGDSGVAVASTESLEVLARIPTGRGAHQIAFSGDNQFVFVTNAVDGTVSIIDNRTLKKVQDIRTGSRPASVAYSMLAQMAYVTNEGDGTVVGVSAKQRGVLVRIHAEPGLGQIKFSQDERFGFAVNPVTDKVCIVDVSTNRIAQSLSVKGAPDQVSFSESLAYVRRNKSDTVAIIPLAQLAEGKPISTAEFPGGQHRLGQTANPSLADSIIPAPGEGAMLIANPADKSIYYYMEGMAAPVGNFSNFGREPRAVLIVDRSFREQAPGVYKTVGKIGGPGLYDVLFLLDSPRITHCFQVTVEPDPDSEAKANQPAVRIESLQKDNRVSAGQAARLAFRFSDRRTGELRTGVLDVQVLVFLAPGVWQTRGIAREISRGIYSMEFVPPKPGIYYIHLESESLGLPLNNSQYNVLEVTPRVKGSKE